MGFPWRPKPDSKPDEHGGVADSVLKRMGIDIEFWAKASEAAKAAAKLFVEKMK